MNELKYNISRIFIAMSTLPIFFIGLFFFINQKDTTVKLNESTQQISKMPKTAFWIAKGGEGNWYSIDRIYNHKNKATISIYDKSKKLLSKNQYFISCPINELKFINDLKKQIVFYDGENITLKDNCYLIKR